MNPTHIFLPDFFGNLLLKVVAFDLEMQARLLLELNFFASSLKLNLELFMY